MQKPKIPQAPAAPTPAQSPNPATSMSGGSRFGFIPFLNSVFTSVFGLRKRAEGQKSSVTGG
jgi:hypothetical protein